MARGDKCARCRDPTDSDLKACSGCRTRDRDRQRRQRAKGDKCVYCLNKPREGKVHCEYHATLLKTTNHTWKLKALDKCGGQYCKCCGETLLDALTVDHVNNDGYLKKQERGTYFYRAIMKRSDISDLQVLCYNCNISKYRNNGTCGHKRKE